MFILGFYFITQRYEGELLPWLLLCYALFVAHWRFDGRVGKLVLRALPVLVSVSAVASVASTLDFHLRLSGDTPQSYKRDLARVLRPRPHFEPWTGHRVYLSDLVPVSTTFTFDKMGLDQSFDGKVLDVQGRFLRKGLGMHAVSTAVYRVPEGPPPSRRLSGCPRRSGAPRAACATRSWTRTGACSSTRGSSGGSDPGRVARVSLRGVREVTLKLGDGGDGIDNDHGVWGEVAFLTP